MENIFEYDDTMSFESNYRMWKHMNDKEHRDNGEEVYDDTTSKSVFVQMWGIKIMAKYGKPSDSIIDYPDLDLTSVEQIEQWLSDLKTEDDLYAIKW